MGSWGHGIFESDVAGDVRGELEALMEGGLSIAEASREVITAGLLSEIPEDDDMEATLGWSALALTQIEHGALTRGVRDYTIRLLKRPLPGGYPDYFTRPDGPERQRAVFDATIAELRDAPVID